MALAQGLKTCYSTPALDTLPSPPLYKIPVAQAAAALLMAAAIGVFSGPTPAGVALLGGLISTAGNGYFVLQAALHGGDEDAKRVVRAFSRGELGKLGITIVLFALCFTLIPAVKAHPPVLLLGFVMATVAGLIMTRRVCGEFDR